MHKGIVGLLLIFTGAMVFSCRTFRKEEVTAPSAYFDVRAFFQNEIQRLQQANPSIEKVARLNGKKEVKEETNIDWERELSVFLEIDITKPAMRGVYEIDSVLLDEGALQITYSTDQSDFSIREISVILSEGTPRVVEARVINDSFLYSSEKRLRYKRNEGYAVQGSQDIVFIEERKYRVDARFSHQD